MKLIHGIDSVPKIDRAVVTSGTFDGVHFGHQRILKQVVDHAKNIGGSSVVLTYWPHPRFILSEGSSDLKLLSTFEEKVALIEAAGIDYLVQLAFTSEFADLSSDDFVKKILIDRLHTRELVIGYDHRFGKNRTGGFDYLKTNSHHFGFNVVEIARQDIDDVGVSSTKVRQALTQGMVHQASHYLGRPYSIMGRVVEGQKLGTSIGFPTANILVEEDYKLIPMDGAYAVKVNVGDQMINGMLNIGQRPTIGAGRSIEVNLFDFDEEIYGLLVEVHFVQRLRDEKKFDSLDKLIDQLKLDQQHAQKILATE